MTDPGSLVDRIRASRDALLQAGRVFQDARRADAARRGLTFAPGDRVFDTVSGEEGEVIDGTRENLVVPAAR